MTFYFDNVYIKNTSTVTGPYEKDGSLVKYFDKSYDDLYINKDSLEEGEVQLIRDSLNILLKKNHLKKEDIDLIIGGDLLNQLSASSYGSLGYGKSFMGVYSACSTSVLELIIASSLINSSYITNAICMTSSHNLTAEKQFRQPIEYGGDKPITSTFTVTGAASIFLTNKPTDIKIESATLGRIINMEENNPNNMGRVMAPSAIDTLVRHFKDTGRNPNYYDLILTGDLGKYGKKIVNDYLNTYEEINISSNYEDSGVLIYDVDKEEIAGASGPACLALVAYSYIYELLRKKKIKKVLLVGTGALFSPTFLQQKFPINSIAHAISLEVVDAS